MKKLLCLLPLIILCMACTKSKRMSFLNVDEYPADRQPPTDVAAFEARYGEFDGVYVYIDDIIEHSGIKESSGYYGIGDKWSFCNIHKYQYVVLDPDVTWLTTFKIGYKPDKLIIRIIDPDGAVRLYGEDDLLEQKDSEGGTTFKLAYPDIVKGTLVEVAYENEFSVHPEFAGYFLDHEVLLQRTIPCESINFTYMYPDWWKIKVKKIAKDRGIPYVETHDTENKKIIVSYRTTDVPALTPEPYSPFFKEVADYLELMIVDLAMKGGTYEGFSDWQELAGRFRDYTLKKSDKQSFDLDHRVDGLLNGSETPLQSLEKIVGFISDSITVGAGQQANYGKILKKMEGNAYDLTGMARAMLARVGIESSYLLVHDAEDGYFDSDYVAGDQLYVPALRVTIDSLDYVVFPYVEDLPVNHTPPNYQGQPALVITDDPKAAWFWTVPEGNRADNAIDENYVLNIAADGAIEVTEQRVYRGSLAYSMRRHFSKLTDEETEDVIKELLTYTDGDVEMTRYEIKNLEAYKEPLRIEIVYGIDNLVTVTPDEIIFQTAGLFSPISFQEEKLEAENRVNPIKISYDEQYNKSISITYPPDWYIVTTLADFEFANRFGSIHGVYGQDGNTLSVDQQLNLVTSFAPKEEIGALIELAGQTSRLNIPTIVFSTGGGQETP